jgi:hypothetical protein
MGFDARLFEFLAQRIAQAIVNPARARRPTTLSHVVADAEQQSSRRGAAGGAPAGARALRHAARRVHHDHEPARCRVGGQGCEVAQAGPLLARRLASLAATLSTPPPRSVPIHFHHGAGLAWAFTLANAGPLPNPPHAGLDVLVSDAGTASDV